MALIDMVTDIKSFNYKKVGQKHDEYFGEDAATGFTPNRETGDKTEFLNKDSVFGPGGNVNFFKDKNATGFTDNRDTGDPTEYIPGSGNDFNFKNKTNTVDYFLNKNQTGFTHDRFNIGGDDIGNTEFIIGSGNAFNFAEPIGFSTFNVNKPYLINRNPGNRFAEGAVLPDTEFPDPRFSNISRIQGIDNQSIFRPGFLFSQPGAGGLSTYEAQDQAKVSFYIGVTDTNFDTGVSIRSTGLDAQIETGYDGVNVVKGIAGNNNFAEGFTPKRTTKDLGPFGGGFAQVEPGDTAGQYKIGSGLLDLDGSPISGPTDFFPDSFGVGFVPNLLETYNANELNTDGSAGRSMFNLGTVIENAGAADGAQENFSGKLGIGNVRDARNDVVLQSVEDDGREIPLSSSPNIPFSYQFSEIHPYGEAPNRVALKDRDDIDDQYIKFGGNAGLRASTPGNPGNGNEGQIGFDEPFITKEIGENGYSELSKLDAGIFRGGLPLNVLRVADDALRLGSWTLTAKGIIWNAKQFLLQAQSATIESRLFNPAGVLGSIIPGVHLPRHTIGTFTDFNEPPGYDTAPDGFNVSTVDGPASQAIPEDPQVPDGLFAKIQFFKDRAEAAKEKLERKIAAAKALASGVPITNRLEALHATRIEEEGKDVKENEAGFSEALGLGNKHFINPHHVVKSTKSSYGADLKNVFGSQIKDKYTDKELITNYPNLTDFRDKEFGQSGVDSSEVGPETLYPTVANSDVVKKGKSIGNSSAFDLGRSKMKKGSKVYEVGVSNMLQVPYHGQFNKLNSSLEGLPKDFIKFRIREAVNGKWLIFPAHLGQVTDTVTPEYTKDRYIGRPDQVHIYTGASRNISFDFKVAAFTKQEIPIIQEKMNYLMGLGYPTYKEQGIPVSPYVYLTIGDLYNNTPGYFENISITIEEGATWEIDDGFQIPQFFNVSLTFVYIGKYLPTTTGKHYEVPWLTDNGSAAGKYGTFKTDPRDGSTNGPDRGIESWAGKLPTNV